MVKQDFISHLDNIVSQERGYSMEIFYHHSFTAVWFSQHLIATKEI